jgi:hypothetical protein
MILFPIGQVPFPAKDAREWREIEETALILDRFWLPVGQPSRRQREDFLSTKWEMIQIY